MKKGNSLIGAILLLILCSATFGGALPLNTGWDYSNYANFSVTSTTPLDNYWIKISAYPAGTGTPGPTYPTSLTGTWAPVPPGLVPSTWLGAYGNPAVSGSGVTAQNPGYVIYRKCFCLPQGYGQASIRGAVRADEGVQIWLNSVLNTVLPPSPVNFGSVNNPHNINYATQSGFRTGRNCMYVLVEDTGGMTGFNLNAAVTTSNGTPMIAQGVNMTFSPCACGGQALPGAANRRVDDEDKKAVEELIKIAEAKRIEIIRIRNPKN